MTAALSLIQTVVANGGQIRVEDGWLVIAPEEAAKPYLDDLRKHKAEIMNLLRPQGRPDLDPAEWRQPFIWWLDSACTLRPRDCGGLNALHRAFCEWEIARDEVPCDRRTFIRMLLELGFLIGEINGTMLVWGLVFRSDVEAEYLGR